jgi:hypothetical protein
MTSDRFALPAEGGAVSDINLATELARFRREEAERRAQAARTCTRAECGRPAEVTVDGWLFAGPIPWCREHADNFMAYMRREYGWTAPFRVVEVAP